MLDSVSYKLICLYAVVKDVFRYFKFRKSASTAM